MASVAFANKTISPPDNVADLRFKNGNTKDIMKVIVYADSRIKEDLKEFAKAFSKDKAGLKDIYNFTRNNINYIADSLGHEKVKAPRVVWADRFADCKSLSLFEASIMQNVGFDYKYRFTSYKSDRRVTHIYPIAILPSGEDVIIDACHNRFNSEPDFTYAVDYYPKLAKFIEVPRISGVEQAVPNWIKILAGIWLIKQLIND